MSAPIDFATLARLTGSRLGKTDAPCPLCGPDRRSPANRSRPVLAIWRHEPNFATYYCARCGESGWAREDGGRTIERAELTKLRAAASERDTLCEAKRIAAAGRIWREAQYARGTIVERYLTGRGLTIPDGAELRFHPACPRSADRVPAMVALFTDIKTGEPTGIHRTFLKADGSGKAEIEPAKMTLGRAGGSCIKLSPDEDVTDELGLSEGIENGLTALCAGWAPVWAVGSSGTLKAFPVLPGIEALTVFADPKPQEMVAARACADRWTAAGREVTIWEPHGGDWNDVMRGLGNEHDDGG
jgi:hypothetical protein